MIPANDATELRQRRILDVDTSEPARVRALGVDMSAAPVLGRLLDPNELQWQGELQHHQWWDRFRRRRRIQQIPYPPVIAVGLPQTAVAAPAVPSGSLSFEYALPNPGEAMPVEVLTVRVECPHKSRGQVLGIYLKGNHTVTITELSADIIGLRVGDILVQIDGRPCTYGASAAARRIMARRDPTAFWAVVWRPLLK